MREGKRRRITMERYFEVSPTHKYYKAYFDYRKDRQGMKELFNEFSELFGIKATYFIPLRDEIGILPTDEDLQCFEKYLKVCNGKEGIRFFRKNTIYTKHWQAEIKERDLKGLSKPMFFYFIRELHKESSRAFDIDGKLYGSIDSPDDYTLPEGFIEMKASQFHKIIEDNF